MITALMDNTFIYVWNKSINLINLEDIESNFPIIKSTKLNLNKGDVLIFRADLIHAGSDYINENIRLHVYLDNPLLKRDKNKTYIISKTFLKNIIKRKKMIKNFKEFLF